MSGTQSEHLPTVQSEITAEWLGAQLGHKIRSLENTQNIWGTGSKLFYTIEYEDGRETTGSDRPKHICVKGVFDPKMVESQPWTVPLAQREADFFSKVAPALENSTMIFPKGWWSATSEKQGIAIMEDLTKSGCTFAPEVAAYPYEKVMNGVEQLAGLHAKYWGQGLEDHPCTNSFSPLSQAPN